MSMTQPSLIHLLDVVALTIDRPQDNLWRGQVGTVVEILANGAAFEVEFSDRVIGIEDKLTVVGLPLSIAVRQKNLSIPENRSLASS
jgi:hypothetical protein